MWDGEGGGLGFNFAVNSADDGSPKQPGHIHAPVSGNGHRWKK